MRGRLGAAATAVVAVASLAASEPAAAHPFGPPLRAALTAEGRTVTVHWSAAEDDWVLLARHLGVFDDAREDASAGELTGLQRLQRAEDLGPYLLDHLQVRQDGASCSGELADVDRLLEAGAELRFACPGEVGVVDVRLTALTDVHTAYRTVATAAGSQAMATAAEPELRLDLTATGSDGLDVSRLAPLAVVPVVLLVVVALRPSRRWVPWGR